MTVTIEDIEDEIRNARILDGMVQLGSHALDASKPVIDAITASVQVRGWPETARLLRANFAAWLAEAKATVDALLGKR